MSAERRRTVKQRYRWTGKTPEPRLPNGQLLPPRPSDTLSGGWSTTALLLSAIDRAQRIHVDGCFTFAELQDCVRTLMAQFHISFMGEWVHARRYKDDAARVLQSRFGDLRRGHVFELAEEPASQPAVADPAVLGPAAAPTILARAPRIAGREARASHDELAVAGGQR